MVYDGFQTAFDIVFLVFQSMMTLIVGNELTRPIFYVFILAGLFGVIRILFGSNSGD